MVSSTPKVFGAVSRSRPSSAAISMVISGKLANSSATRAAVM
jgi:hypothetical protein